MALFTNTQASACTIKECGSLKIDGVHQFWTIVVEDEDGYTIDWTDSVTAGDATDTEIKVAMKNYLTTEIQKRPSVVPVISMVDNATIINTSIG